MVLGLFDNIVFSPIHFLCLLFLFPTQFFISNQFVFLQGQVGNEEKLIYVDLYANAAAHFGKLIKPVLNQLILLDSCLFFSDLKNCFFI